MRGSMGHVGRLFAFAAPLALASIAVGQEVRDLPIQTIVAEARPYVFTDGISQEEFHQNMAALSARLSAETPAGALITPLQVRVTNDEAAELANAPFTGESPMKVGFVRPLEQVITVTNLDRAMKLTKEEVLARGTLSRTQDGGIVWAASFTGPGAAGLRVHVENLRLPRNAELYIYSPLGEAYGPYTSAADLWTNSVQGSTAIVQLRVSGPVNAADLRNTSFRITEVGYIGPEFYGGLQGNTASFCQFNEDCIENVNCGSNAAVNNAKNAVAKMLWVQGCCIYTCSGGLIADNNPNVSNLFLTANHCLSTSGPAANLEAFFSYDVSCNTTTCTATFTDPPANLISGVTLGATVAATGSTSDYTILQLSQNPPGGSVFLGWSTTAVANSDGTNLYRVSHPSGAPQAYSAHNVDTGSPTCQGWPRGAWIYSQDQVGATEGGSSGSPVVNSSGQIVGQLTGGCGFNIGDVCDSANNWTVDGAFANYFNNVSSLLNGGGGGCLPNGSNCSSNGQCCSNKCRGGRCR